MKKETIIISLGGSIVVPNEINIKFLKKFKDLILKHVKLGKRFFIISGGGRTCRNYQNALKAVRKVSNADLDWLGIYSTRFNAQLIRMVFGDKAYPKIIYEPNIHKKINQNIVIGAGWKPGWSTDFVSSRLAQTYKIKKVINLSNISYVYDKDPSKYKTAKALKQISWKDYLKLVGSKWTPGANFPYDPIASKLSQKLKLEISILKGTDLKNLNNYLFGKSFKGTVIKDY